MKRTTLLTLIYLLLVGCAAPVQLDTVDSTETEESAIAEAPVETAGFPVTIVHDAGEITLDQPAERIVVMSEEMIELAIALDAKLVGVGAGRNEPVDGKLPEMPYLERPIVGEPVYLDAQQPSMEAIFALEPDLIFRNGPPAGFDDEFREQFEQIAPTLTYVAAEPGGWKNALRGLAMALGRTELAEQTIADYDARVAELQAEMAPVVEQAPDVTLLVGSPDVLGIVDEQFAIGGIMQTLGFTLSVPESIEMPPFGYNQISPEILGEVTAETIVQMRRFDGKEYAGDEILNSLEIPVLLTEIRQGMPYAGPFAEVIYLESFANGFREQYLSE
ncbi:MAG: ABC transporter substrate-binding protein [Chloroflexota bacterium]